MSIRDELDAAGIEYDDDALCTCTLTVFDPNCPIHWIEPDEFIFEEGQE